MKMVQIREEKGSEKKERGTDRQTERKDEEGKEKERNVQKCPLEHVKVVTCQ